MSLLEFIQQPAVIRLFGLAGASAAALGTLISALAYRGRDGERYSLFNHFISELGEVGVSQLAWVFNLGLILCGALLLVCGTGLGLLIPGLWAKLALFSGVLTSIAVAAVGVFPMNKINAHIRAATAYFRMGLVMVILYTIAIFTQPEPPILPRAIGLVGLPAICAYAFFLLYMHAVSRTGQAVLSPALVARPRFWTMTIAEWMIFWTTVPWLFAVAMGL